MEKSTFKIRYPSRDDIEKPWDYDIGELSLNQDNVICFGATSAEIFCCTVSNRYAFQNFRSTNVVDTLKEIESVRIKIVNIDNPLEESTMSKEIEWWGVLRNMYDAQEIQIEGEAVVPYRFTKLNFHKDTVDGFYLARVLSYDNLEELSENLLRVQPKLKP